MTGPQPLTVLSSSLKPQPVTRVKHCRTPVHYSDRMLIPITYTHPVRTFDENGREVRVYVDDRFMISPPSLPDDNLHKTSQHAVLDGKALSRAGRTQKKSKP